jgi:hypothetical protein
MAVVSAKPGFAWELTMISGTLGPSGVPSGAGEGHLVVEAPAVIEGDEDAAGSYYRYAQFRPKSY